MSRLARFFLAPAGEAAASDPRPRGFAAPSGGGAPAAAFAPPLAPVARPLAAVGGDVVVLAPAADVHLAAGIGAAHLRSLGAPAVVALWAPDGEKQPLISAPGSPTAERRVRRLAARGVTARAHGALTYAVLPPDPVAASAELGRVRAVAGDPIAIVLARRHPAFDGLLADAAAVLVLRAGEPAMTALVVHEVARLRPGVLAVDPPGGAIARFRYRHGLARAATSPLPEPARVGS